MSFSIKEENGFKYVEQGEGPVILLLHGLFGALSNFSEIFHTFSDRYKIIIPLLPIYEKTKTEASVEGMTTYVEDFVSFRGLKDLTLLGNSLGGHVALTFAIRQPELVSALVLTGSSGLFEAGMGKTFPKRSDYKFVRDRVRYTFYDPQTATDELVDEVYDIFQNNYKTLRIVRVARSAQRHNMREVVGQIKAPTLLIWGLNDNITPPRVAHEFESLMPNTELKFIDKCGHAAMMEQPEIFNAYLEDFLKKHVVLAA